MTIAPRTDGAASLCPRHTQLLVGCPKGFAPAVTASNQEGRADVAAAATFFMLDAPTKRCHRRRFPLCSVVAVNPCQPLHKVSARSSVVDATPNGRTSHCHSFLLMRLSHERGPGYARSDVRAALAASQSGSSVRCGASLVWHSRAQRHRLRRKRRAFM